MNRYCIIGARGGSKSIENKNIKTIDGRSLLSICAEKALKCNIYDKIFISSDNKLYKNFLPEHRNIEFILRPVQIAQDTSTEIEYISHVIKCKDLDDESLISRMQCTSPFQSIASMKSAVEKMQNNLNEIDSVQLISRTSPSIDKIMFKCEKTGLLSSSNVGGSIGPSNRQGLQKSYFRSNFYVTTVANILSEKLLGYKSYGLECEEREKIDIDTAIDLKIARALAKEYGEWLEN